MDAARRLRAAALRAQQFQPPPPDGPAAAASDLEAVDNYGRCPLHLACSKGRGEVARYLVDSGAALDVEDNHGHTPGALARLKGHAGVALCLAADAGGAEGRARRSNPFVVLEEPTG